VRDVELDFERLLGLVRSGPTPLFATVSGAHLYGFSSPDSDVDLRGAYVRPLRDVLRLKIGEETITISRVDDDLELDWVAHDVHKFCRLMTRRNGYVLEQLYSPLVVYGGEWLEELREIGRGFIVGNLVHHYRGFYHTCRKHLEKPQATVKDLLYAYRVLHTGIHVLTVGEIEANLPALHPGDEVSELIVRKRKGAEKGRLADADRERHLPALDILYEKMNEARAKTHLPEEPTRYDDLDDYVVRARVALGWAHPGSDHLQ